MYARTVDIAAESDGVRLLSGERIAPGWYMLRAAYNLNDTEEYGGVLVFFAASGVSQTSADCIALNPTEAQVIHLDVPSEVLIRRSSDSKARLVITEV